jgi:hypothetical protein
MGTPSKPTTPAEQPPRRGYRKARDTGEYVNISARRVVDAKRDSREGDFAARARRVTAIPKQSPLGRNVVRIYNRMAIIWHSYAIDFMMGWSLGESQVLLVQNKCQQGLVDLNPTAVVFDEAQFSKFVHEEIHARARGADYF